MTDNERHELWLTTIRTTVADRIVCEKERVPSYTAQWRHWLCSCWVCKLWKNSPLCDVYDNLPRPEDSGWMIRPTDASYQIDWEAPDVAAEIQSNIDFLLKGCSCKKGCRSRNCGCRKKGNYCGPGCECQGCSNLPVEVQQEENDDSDDDEDSDIENDSNDYGSASDSCEELETEIITDELLYNIEITGLNYYHPLIITDHSFLNHCKKILTTSCG